jgi:subtilisin family serine protease
VGDVANDVRSGHGTHVAGSVLGNGAASNGAIRGMAPAARLVFQAIERNNTGALAGIPADYNTLFQQAYNNGARIHTNSWGNHLHGQYTAASQDIDEFMWNHKYSIILFSASNDGVDNNNDGVVDADSLSAQACAKNCITVGASENNRATGGYNPGGACSTYGTCWPGDFPANPLRNDRLSNNPNGMVAFSGRGPTDDGRPKPDVVAPGTNILSVRSSVAVGQGNWGQLPAADPNRPFYWYMGGTSMSTPLTAGTVALIRQYLQRVCLHANPSGALLKAILLHGATPIAGQYVPSEVGAVPDNSQGWGRVNLRNSLFPDHPVKWEFRDNPADAVGTAEQRNYTFPVVDSTVPFRATLAWTDFPSDPAGAIGLVNQLRLSVIAPNGATTQGNPANNNVQRIVINNPQVGNYTVSVTGVNVPTLAARGERQDFALVVSGGLDFVDLYIKDNPADQGIPPSVGTLYQSPDIWVSLDNDPTLPPAANPEYGQTNYVFVRVHNRGPRTANNATVKLYWAKAGTNLSRPYWKTDGITVGGVAGNAQQVTVAGRTAAGDGQSVTPAFEWRPPDPSTYTVEPGHFCLFATVTHADDPLLQEDVGAVGWEDNLAWKNVDVKDVLPNTETTTEFYVAGDAGASVRADLHIDRCALPPGSSVKLKIPSRWLVGATTANLQQVWQSAGGRVCRVEVTGNDTADIQGINLQPGENTLAMLEVTLSEAAVPGELYPVYVDQKVNGQPRGRVTLLARTVGTPAYIANRNSAEIHLANCDWVAKISPRNKVPYNDLNLALQRGYNGCRFCLPGYDTG